MPQTSAHSKFAICIANKDCDDLQVWKLYRVIDDHKALVENYLRIVDNSGEDYLYPASRFMIVEFPELIEQRLLATDALKFYPFTPKSISK